MTPDKETRKGWPDANWTCEDCPECGAPFMAIDEHGEYCCVCTFQKDETMTGHFGE